MSSAVTSENDCVAFCGMSDVSFMFVTSSFRVIDVGLEMFEYRWAHTLQMHNRPPHSFLYVSIDAPSCGFASIDDFENLDDDLF